MRAREFVAFRLRFDRVTLRTTIFKLSFMHCLDEQSSRGSRELCGCCETAERRLAGSERYAYLQVCPFRVKAVGLGFAPV